MDLFDMLGPAVAAELGARRGTVPRHYFCREDAPGRLAEALQSATAGRTVLVFFDERTRAVAGIDAMAALRSAGWTIRECLIPDGPRRASPVCDDLTKATLQARLPAADAFVAVGSGVVNDLTKWLAMDVGVPYAVLATAASMNGYSAANVAVTINGVKGLLDGRAPPGDRRRPL
jgi:glycerol-1-phosphate dehydrogenase [NAD(P)+]